MRATRDWRASVECLPNKILAQHQRWADEPVLHPWSHSFGTTAMPIATLLISGSHLCRTVGILSALALRRRTCWLSGWKAHTSERNPTSYISRVDGTVSSLMITRTPEGKYILGGFSLFVTRAHVAHP